MSKISDERREVAARLRKTRGIMAFVDALGIDEDSDWCWADVSRRVADLIDPTCEVESVDSTAGLPAYNLSCGDTVFVHLNELMPSYCPYCGARLVDEDGE